MCGLTNYVYKVQSQNQTVIYRKYSNTFSLFQDREREVNLQEELAQLGLAPKVLYADKEQRIEEFWPYLPVTLQEIKTDYMRIAKMLGSFHKLNQQQTIEKLFNQPSIYQWLHNQNLRDKIFDVIDSTNSKQLINTFEEVFSDKSQTFIFDLLDHPALKELSLVMAHNDLNATNFLKDQRLGQYHIIDFEFSGLNYPGYELANFFNEMEWDYTHPHPPYFKIQQGWDENLKQDFVKEYWNEYAGQVEPPKALFQQIEIGSILQNYFWMLIGGLSFQQENHEIDLEEYVNTRMKNFIKIINYKL